MFDILHLNHLFAQAILFFLFALYNEIKFSIFSFYVLIKSCFSFGPYDKIVFSVLLILSQGGKKCCPKVWMLSMERRQLSSYTSVSEHIRLKRWKTLLVTHVGRNVAEKFGRKGGSAAQQLKGGMEKNQMQKKMDNFCCKMYWKSTVEILRALKAQILGISGLLPSSQASHQVKHWKSVGNPLNFTTAPIWRIYGTNTNLMLMHCSNFNLKKDIRALKSKIAFKYCLLWEKIKPTKI